jgi:hypothetical protein
MWRQHDRRYEQMHLMCLPWSWADCERNFSWQWGDRERNVSRLWADCEKTVSGLWADCKRTVSRLSWKWPLVWTNGFKYKKMFFLTMNWPWADSERTMSWPWRLIWTNALKQANTFPELKRNVSWPWADCELIMTGPWADRERIVSWPWQDRELTVTVCMKRCTEMQALPLWQPTEVTTKINLRYFQRHLL